MLLATIPDLARRGQADDAVRGEVPNPITPPSGCSFHPRCPLADERCRQRGAAPARARRRPPRGLPCGGGGARHGRAGRRADVHELDGVMSSTAQARRREPGAFPPPPPGPSPPPPPPPRADEAVRQLARRGRGRQRWRGRGAGRGLARPRGLRRGARARAPRQSGARPARRGLDRRRGRRGCARAACPPWSSTPPASSTARAWSRRRAGASSIPPPGTGLRDQRDRPGAADEALPAAAAARAPRRCSPRCRPAWAASATTGSAAGMPTAPRRRRSTSSCAPPRSSCAAAGRRRSAWRCTQARLNTGLSAPFAKSGLQVQTPAEAAARLLAVIERLGPGDSGEFFDHRGEPVPW